MLLPPPRRKKKKRRQEKHKNKYIHIYSSAFSLKIERVSLLFLHLNFKSIKITLSGFRPPSPARRNKTEKQKTGFGKKTNSRREKWQNEGGLKSCLLLSSTPSSSFCLRRRRSLFLSFSRESVMRKIREKGNCRKFALRLTKHYLELCFDIVYP